MQIASLDEGIGSCAIHENETAFPFETQERDSLRALAEYRRDVGIEPMLTCGKPTSRPIRMSGSCSEGARSGGRCARTCWSAWREASASGRRLMRLRGSIVATRREKLFAPRPASLRVRCLCCADVVGSEGPTGFCAVSPADFPGKIPLASQPDLYVLAKLRPATKGQAKPRVRVFCKHDRSLRAIPPHEHRRMPISGIETKDI